MLLFYIFRILLTSMLKNGPSLEKVYMVWQKDDEAHDKEIVACKLCIIRLHAFRSVILLELIMHESLQVFSSNHMATFRTYIEIYTYNYVFLMQLRLICWLIK